MEFVLLDNGANPECLATNYETGNKSDWTDWNSVGLNPSRIRTRVVRRLERIW